MGKISWVFCLFCVAAAADEGLSRPKFEPAFSIGSTFAAKSAFDTTLTGSSSKFRSTSGDSGRPGFAMSAELAWNFSDQFGATAILDSVKYRYSDGTTPDDVFFLGGGAKLYTKASDSLWFWATAAVGIAQNRLGKMEEIDGTSKIRVKNQNSTGFAVSPRAGADFKITDGLTLRAQISFTEAKFVHNLEASSNGIAVGSGAVDLDRSFFGAYVGVTGGF